MKRPTTLTELRQSLRGRIYMYFDSEEIYKKFLKNAEEEGFLFNKIKPTQNSTDSIIALEHRKQLSYVGFVGHVAFQCNGGTNAENFYRIDYRKFLNGEEDYFYKQPKSTVYHEQVH